MLNGRLQPKRTVLALRVLFMLVGALGFAAGAGRAGQTRTNTPPAPNKVEAQTPPSSPKLVPNQPPHPVPSERPKTAPISAQRHEPGRTTKTRIAPAERRKPIHRPSPVWVSGQPSGEAPATAVGGELPQTVAPSAMGGESPQTVAPSAQGEESPQGATPSAEGNESAQTGMPSLQSIAAGRRDPFKAWVVPAPGGHLSAGGAFGALPAGIRGLVISELRLEGTVRQESANTMIAVVTNYTKQAYFLRVNDTVYNGVVSKITPEAIYFRQNTLDSSGRVTTREVEIKLGSAPGEGR
jgi:hypothetical protein